MRRQRDAGKRQRPRRALRARLDEAEATLEAIRTGEVDAVIVAGPQGARTLPIEGASLPYQVLLNAMSDGAALLDRSGAILFGNRRLGEIARVPAERLRGSQLPQFVATSERSRLEALVRNGVRQDRGQEFAMAGAGRTPVWIALSAVPLAVHSGRAGASSRTPTIAVMAIITDLTERKRAEVTRLDLTKRLISAEDDERRRIARELHDETGQSLTALLVGLRAIEDRVVRGAVQTAVRRLRRVAAETVKEVGRLARGLYPAVLDDLGLASAVRRHVSDFTKLFGVQVSLRLGPTIAGPLSPLLQTTVYRILQEALTNVARHARAHVVEIALNDDGATVQLVIRDDGVGFDAATVLAAKSGFGLHGMEERVALLGGAVEVESSPGLGTTIRARLPVGTVAPSRPRPPERRTRRRRA